MEKPELQDFGITLEEYGGYHRREIEGPVSKFRKSPANRWGLGALFVGSGILLVILTDRSGDATTLFLT
mgnify:CR=1 FL=1